MKSILLIFMILISLNIAVFAQQGGLYEEMMVFSDVLNHVRTNYVEETEPSKLISAAVNGLLSSLDPHTIYLDSWNYRKFLSITTGKTYGVGIAFEIIDGFPTIISVLPGGPAAKARIKTGDILLRVDDKSVINIAIPKLQLLLSGIKGSKVKLTLKKYMNKREYVVTLKRDEIPIHSINYYFMLKSKIGYIKIDYFSQTTAEELQSVLKKFNKKRMRRLILDLRGNSGGSLSSAIQVVDMFLPEGKIIMSTKGRKKEANQTYFSSNENTQPLCPLIILINRGSASASEVVAGALQEYDRALLVGTNSFGKGLVQGIFLLNNGGAILMTIARYYTPTGRLIQRQYKGKSFDEYYTEIFETDTLNYKNRPQLKTMGGRTIYGGGGIVPDVFIEAKSPPFSNWNEMEESKVLLKFATEYVKENKDKLEQFKDFEDYTKNFSLDKKTIDKLIQKILDEGFEIENLNEKQVDYLSSIITAEIAGVYWDIRASLYITLNKDVQLKKAIDSFPQIGQLLRTE